MHVKAHPFLKDFYCSAYVEYQGAPLSGTLSQQRRTDPRSLLQ